MPYVSINNLSLYYEDIGLGEPIIFIHGSLSRGASTFSAQIPFFEHSNRCICPDLRGHGKTSCSDLHWTPMQLADDIIALMDKLQIPKANIVGHSMGGDVAMYCAINHSSRISSIVSISSGGAVNDSVTAYLAKFDPQNIDMTKYFDFIENMKKEHLAAHNGNWQEFLTQTIVNCNKYPDFSDNELQKITMPFLLIYGNKDTMIKEGEIERLRKNIKDAKVICLEDTGHFPHISNQKCKEVNKIISEFIHGG